MQAGIGKGDVVATLPAPTLDFADACLAILPLRAANSGRPLPGVQVKITDLDSNALPPDGRPARLGYKSPYLFLGYLQEDGSVKLPLDDDGCFDSGDCGLMAGDLALGTAWITQRTLWLTRAEPAN
jgi:acyl-CoA synthetase (AMP-forming)/AMP-acid ligase II